MHLVFSRRTGKSESKNNLCIYLEWSGRKSFACRDDVQSIECQRNKWKRIRNKPRARQLLLAKIHEILDEHPDNKNYGIDRVHITLQQKGEIVSRSTVIRAMRKGDLIHRSYRSPNGLTKADKKAQRPENILKRDFSATPPN